MCLVHPDGHLGENVQVGDSVILGHPPRDAMPGELPLGVADNCIVRSHTIMYAGSRLGSDVQTGHGLAGREHSTIADNVSTGSGAAIEHYVSVGKNAHMLGHNLTSEHTDIGDGCWFGLHARITNVLHPRCLKAKDCIKGPTLERGAKVGGSTTLAPDITIGEMALVGAGLVLKDGQARAVAVETPARVIKHIDELECPYGLVDHAPE